MVGSLVVLFFSLSTSVPANVNSSDIHIDGLKMACWNCRGFGG